ncbi:hypothetical protein EGW08_002820 [Elysia chlorotica]|uniref:Uncharacterized protein n=1 Tax=Elysia chlorotica TaxID=188477 RepID=A0A3S1BR50_ELYCH|nr:hypothetical protein EGW08_002820 [Elysia chlorotica]
MPSEECTSLLGRVLFRLGQLLLAAGIMMTFLGISTSNWVVRPKVNYATQNIQANSTLVTENFGLFIACRQSEFGRGRGECGSVWKNTNFVTVVMLTSMVIFAGEVKNKAERVSGQEDEKSGWSFIVALIGLIFCVLGLVLVTMLRDLPIQKPGLKGGTWLRVASRSSGQRA